MNESSYPKRGEIYLIDFSKGGKSSEQKGYRPALVIQNNIGNKYSSTIIVAALSTKFTHQYIPTNVLCKKQESGLEKDSVINLSQIRTISKKRLKKRIGKVADEIIKKINKALAISIGLIDLPELS